MIPCSASTGTTSSPSACGTPSTRISSCRSRTTRWCTARARSSAACPATRGSSSPICAPSSATCGRIPARSSSSWAANSASAANGRTRRASSGTCCRWIRATRACSAGWAISTASCASSRRCTRKTSRRTASAGCSAATGSRASSRSCARATSRRRRSWWCATSRRCRATTIASACRAAASGVSSSIRMRRSTAARAWAITAAARRRRCRTRTLRNRSPSLFRLWPFFSSSLSRETPPPRVVIESVRPEVDCGRYPVKRAVGDDVMVEADVFTDGHDAVVAELLWRRVGASEWQVVPMAFFHNDHWAASFRVEKLGRYEYTVRGWTDPFLTWQRDLQKRHAAGQDLSIDFLIGAELASPALQKVLKDKGIENQARYRAAVAAIPPAPAEKNTLTYDRTLEVVVEPPRARFSAWYEMFPRSSRGDGQHGSFRDCIKVLPYVAQMGFDVLYLPPIHPIGSTARKGRNNAVSAEPGDVGSPWAIGSKEGGHKAIHPLLGSFSDFELLVKEAKAAGIDVALDIAFQCSPDHPYVKEHPEWFRWRPDGTVQYAENPPKKYQDIYPFEFDSSDFKGLSEELKSVFEFWIGHGVKIFRVDNPHTKPFAFWGWVITELKKKHPDTIFLSEAFTRPRIMHRLSKLGFSQSYTYFTWRNTKQELTEYFTEL